ncbi:MAG: hypothetical protein GF353_23575, partial [Candidatus Lokiarchaeota archaeon]|nr:hypothetical protein [Candidatus Lokiarchaeota archaeon]
KNVFGIYSLSPALRTSAKLKNIAERTILIGESILKKGDSFALRVKRSGKHDYSSQTVAVYIGKQVLENFPELNLKVNLSNPDKSIFIEVRNEFTYIFTDIIKSNWAGLPVERNKNIICMDIGRLEDIAAGFMLMKRGCNLFPILFKITENNKNIELWKSNWNQMLNYSHKQNIKLNLIDITKILRKIDSKLKHKEYFCALCRLIRFELVSKILDSPEYEKIQRARAISCGLALNNSSYCSDRVDLSTMSLSYKFFNHPLFTPIIGFSEKDVKTLLKKISEKLDPIDYCIFKPKYQKFDVKLVEKIYNSLDLKEDFEECLRNIESFFIIN